MLLRYFARSSPYEIVYDEFIANKTVGAPFANKNVKNYTGLLINDTL